MGLLDFFKSKPAPLPVVVQPTGEEHPLAVVLAERHRVEVAAVYSGESGEDLTVVNTRHAEELKSATAEHSINGRGAFSSVYHRTSTALTEAAIALMQASLAETEARTARDYPHIAEAKKEAKSYVSAMERGDVVPSWVQELFDRSRTEAYERWMLGDSESTRQLHKEQRDRFNKWVDVQPAAERWIARAIYNEADDAGVKQASAEKHALTGDLDKATKAATIAPPPQPPSLLNDTSFWDHQVSTIKFLAGDLGNGNGYLLNSGKVRIPGGAKDFHMFAVATVEAASEESVKRVGGQGKDVTFVGTLKDGKRFMATAKSDVYTKFLAASFK